MLPLHKSTPRVRACGLLCASLLAAAATPAAAATFTVNPTQVRLSAQTMSRVLLLRNQSDEPLRFEIRAYRWDQTVEGEMLLEPTRDVVAFPSLFTVAPGEQKTVRVGFTGSVAATEASYRIFVEELPPAPGAPGEGVRMLTRMGIPVFVEPNRPAGRVELSRPQIVGRRVSFAVRNTGNVHVLPQRLRFIAASRTGAVTFERELSAWYVLPGGERRYDIDLPEGVCADLASVSATLSVAGATLEERLPAAACGG